MAVLVGTRDGYHTFASSGRRDHALAGHSVDAMGRGPDSSWIAIVDDREIWHHTADGSWAVLARGEHTLVSLTSAQGVVYGGTADARVVRVLGDTIEALPAFDAAPGRDEWHQVGPPIQVRSLAATADGGVLLANVHVGGILRSTDGGESWEPTMPVDNDVHEVAAHPDREDVVAAAAAVGLLRSHDAGVTWELETSGLESSYSRAIALVGDRLYLSSANGPFAHRSRLTTAPVDDGALEPVGHGLPEEVPGMIDTRFVAASGKAVAIASRAGEVWACTTGADNWVRLADDIDGINCVALT